MHAPLEQHQDEDAGQPEIADHVHGESDELVGDRCQLEITSRVA